MKDGVLSTTPSSDFVRAKRRAVCESTAGAQQQGLGCKPGSTSEEDGIHSQCLTYVWRVSMEALFVVPVFLYSPGCARTYFVDLSTRLALNLQRFTCACLLSARNKGLRHHAQLVHGVS